MKLLSAAEAKAFLSRSDLEALEELVNTETLQVQFHESGPIVVVRKTAVPLFVILEQLGTL